MKHLTFKRLRKINVGRCEKQFHPVQEWSETDWCCALAGEVGELCNYVKKRRRVKAKRNNPFFLKEIGKEIADIQTYLDLVAAKFGFELDKLTISKFNEVSDRKKSKIKL